MKCRDPPTTSKDRRMCYIPLHTEHRAQQPVNWRFKIQIR